MPKKWIYESIRDAEFVYGIKCAHESLNKNEDLNKMLRDSIRTCVTQSSHCSEKRRINRRIFIFICILLIY